MVRRKNKWENLTWICHIRPSWPSRLSFTCRSGRRTKTSSRCHIGKEPITAFCQSFTWTSHAFSLTLTPSLSLLRAAFAPSVLPLPLYPFYGWTWRGGNHQEKVTHSPKAAYNFCTTHLLYPTVSHLMRSWIQHLSHLTRQLYFNCLSFFFHDVCTRTRVLPWMMCHHLTSRAWRFCSPMVSSLHTTVYQQRSFSL